ncbi:MAG: cation diffusion facilitator family transporter [Armatimonadetes bacterium]|nr:cation diffusion facilitator family transporter [Armatimonadota bacterium]
MDNTKVVARKTSVAMLSVISNTTLVVLKLIIGLAIGSVSVISEAIHSGVDLLAAIIALFAVRTAGIPADDDHPFGHHKVENISGTIEALLIFVAAIWIIVEAVERLVNPSPMQHVGWGVGIMLFSAIANIIVSSKLFKVGKETDSMALQADAWHLRTDVYTSAGVMLGLALITIGKWLLPNMNLDWIDPVAAICVAMLIIKAAWDLTIKSGRDLMDVSLPADEETKIKEIIASHSPVVRAFHRLRTRKAGSTRFVQFHLLVSAEMNVEDSHKLNDKIVKAIKAQFDSCLVSIHIEPCDGMCVADCVGCLLDDDAKQLIRENADTHA